MAEKQELDTEEIADEQGIMVSDHTLIRDADTGEVLVNIKGAMTNTGTGNE